jgi:hypothetical protein
MTTQPGTRRTLTTKRTLTPAAGDFGSTQAFIVLFTIFGWIGVAVAAVAIFLGVASLNVVGQDGPVLATGAAILVAMGIGSALGSFISAELLRLAMRAVIALERIAPAGRASGNTTTPTAPVAPVPQSQYKPLPPLP